MNTLSHIDGIVRFLIICFEILFLILFWITFFSHVLHLHKTKNRTIFNIFWSGILANFTNLTFLPLDTGHKLKVHKLMFGRRPRHLLNVLCTFNVWPVSKDIYVLVNLILIIKILSIPLLLFWLNLSLICKNWPIKCFAAILRLLTAAFLLNLYQLQGSN